MKRTLPLYRRMLFIFAAVVCAVALVLVAGVIPAVRVEASMGSTPQMAVQAFWVNFGINVLSAMALVFMAVRSKGRSGITMFFHIVLGLIILLLGLALADAASAYRSHGPAMATASTLLFVCASAAFLTGPGVAATAFLAPKKE